MLAPPSGGCVPQGRVTTALFPCWAPPTVCSGRTQPRVSSIEPRRWVRAWSPPSAASSRGPTVWAARRTAWPGASASSTSTHAESALGPARSGAGEFFCSASGSSATLDIDELEVELNNVHALGGCSGTPVTGELVLCTRCQSSLSGTAEDQGFDLMHGQGANVGALAGFTALYMDDTTYAAVEKADDGTVTWGIVVTSRGGPGGGAVYCAGPGSTWAVTDDGSGTISTLTGLSRLPDCLASANSDAVAGCIR